LQWPVDYANCDNEQPNKSGKMLINAPGSTLTLKKGATFYFYDNYGKCIPF